MKTRIERFNEKWVSVTSGCWVWLTWKGPDGVRRKCRRCRVQNTDTYRKKKARV